MKNSVYFLALLFSFITVGMLNSCQSPAEKVEKAEDKVGDAKQDLKEAEKDANVAAQKAATAEEWKAFKEETNMKIENNEKRISELRTQMKKPGKALDAAYAKSIDALQERNKELKARLDAYENNHSDWEAFKREFNHDMDELGQSLKDFTVNNKK